MKRIAEVVRRAFVEFLWRPSLVIAGFLLLAAGTAVLDNANFAWLVSVHDALRRLFFRNGPATSSLLATVAGSIITVTSITFSLLLLAVQQAASALTPEVYDQFLRRRVNQVYFGFFVGLAIYALIILASVDPPYNPVFGAAVALFLTIVALMLLILLLYTTINEMRPVVVIETIHDRILAARSRQADWIGKTRRVAHMSGSVSQPVDTTTHGYVVRIDVDALGKAAESARDEVEIVLSVCIGSFVAIHDVLAEVRAVSLEDASHVAERVRKAIHVEKQRDLDTDPAYGIEQLSIIAWTSVSTAKSNPAPGLLVLRGLRDIAARWSSPEKKDRAVDPVDETLPVVYADNVFSQLLHVFALLSVVASESMQAQTMTELLRGLASMFERLPPAQQAHVEDILRRSLPALGDQVLTAELDGTLVNIARKLEASGRGQTAAEVRAAREQLGSSVGRLGSRATRATGAAEKL